MIIRVGIMETTVDYGSNISLKETVRAKMHKHMGVKVEGAFHSRAYKSGYWDGITDFYDMQEDKFHTGLLPQFLQGVRELQQHNPNITYKVEDERPPQLVHPDSIDDEIVLGNGDGDPIVLRDYQYEATKSVFRNKVGVLNLATNSGKTLTSAGVMQQILPYLKRGERVAFFTHSRELFHQSAESIRQALNLNDNQIGRIGDGKFNIKGKQIVFVMIPTLNSALKDPRKGVKFTHKERVIKFIAEEVVTKLRGTKNTRQLLRQFIKNCNLTTKVWESALEQLQYIAYDNKFTDKTAQMQLNKYVIEFNKIMEKKNKTKFKKYQDTVEFLESVRVMVADECLVEGTLVTVEGGGWKRIEDVKEGDSIVGGKVTNLIEREVPTVTIKTSHTLLEGTMTHPTFFVRKEDKEDYKKGIKKESDMPYTPLYDLKEGDYLPVKVRTEHEERTKWTKEQLQFVALIMADGHIDKDYTTKEGRVKRSNRVKVNVSRDFEWYLDVFTQGVKAFGVNYEVKHNYDCRGNLTVWTTEKEIKDMLINVFEIPEGKKSNKIKINKEIQYAPLDSIKEFITTYYTCEGDLCITERKQKEWNDSRALNLNTASKELAMGMSLLLRKFNILPRYQVIERELKKHNTMYRLVLGGVQYNKYMDIMSIHNRDRDLSERNTGRDNGVYVGDYLLSPIREVTYTDEVKKVYDFTTTTHVFEANGALTHNCHHSKADTWFNNLTLCENADYRIGLTGTVDKKDKMGYQRLQALFGDVIAKVTNEQMIEQKVSSKPIIRFVPITEPTDIEAVDVYLEAYKKGIVENDVRNEAIAKLVVGYKTRQPGGVLVSVKEIDHGDRILTLLQDKGVDVGFIHGGSDEDYRRDTLKAFGEGKLDVLIASTIIDEGVDLKSIGCMVLAAGGKSMRQQLQRIGRGLRLNGIDGNRVMVFDFYDMTNRYLLNHSKERMKLFKAENFDVKYLGE